MIKLLLVIICLIFLSSRADIYVCDCENPSFLGQYKIMEEMRDGTPIYSNNNEMSFFRNNGFWYLGNLGPWPPETHFRCVEPEGCNFKGEIPPTSLEGSWKAAKRYESGKAPLISTEPCINEEL